jgi:hypothetical protein
MDFAQVYVLFALVGAGNVIMSTHHALRNRFRRLRRSSVLFLLIIAALWGIRFFFSFIPGRLVSCATGPPHSFSQALLDVYLFASVMVVGWSYLFRAGGYCFGLLILALCARAGGQRSKWIERAADGIASAREYAVKFWFADSLLAVLTYCFVLLYALAVFAANDFL